MGSGDNSSGRIRESYLAFPLMVALSRRPMTERELRHTLLGSVQTIRRRLRELEALGYVMKRADRKWALVVRLTPLGVSDLTQQVVETAVEPQETTPESRLQKAHETLGTTQDPGAAPEPTEAPENPPERRLRPSEKLAGHFNVPEMLEGVGRVMVGNIASCAVCGRPTPLKYGIRATCPACARVWSRSDTLNIDEARYAHLQK